MKTRTRIFTTAAFAALCLAILLHGRAAEANNEQVEIRYLPQTLVASSRGVNEVPVEVELVFNEKQGVNVTFDQVRRSFIIPGVSTIEEPVRFENISLPPGAELHQNAAQVIPANVVMLALGGSVEAEIQIRLQYSGVDTQGNTILSDIDIPVRLTNTPVFETFAIGNISVTLPRNGERYAAGKLARAEAKLSVTGMGSVSGFWALNGADYRSFSLNSNGDGEISITADLPAGLKGKNNVQLKITQPLVKTSDIVEFEVAAAKPAKDFDEFTAGGFKVAGVSAACEETAGKVSGSGMLQLPALGLEVPVSFTGLTVIDDEGPKLFAGRIVAETSKTVAVGPLKVEITKLLLTPEGAWIDGKADLEASLLSPGIGPLFIYAMPLAPDGAIDGKVTLKEPQIGKPDGYEVAVSRFEIKMSKSAAAITVGGVVTKPGQPGWKTPLRISVSFGDSD